MANEEFVYSLNDKDYKVVITYKKVRNISYRFRNETFFISANPLFPRKRILEGLEKFAPKLVAHYNRSNSNYDFNDDFVYILGKKNSLKSLGIFSEEELTKYLKKLALEKLTELTRKFEEIMSIKNPYKISVKKMNSRYGSNSLKTRSISYNLNLVHYSEEIMSTVVVHELAHEFHRNHQQKFYNCVYSYCPSYKELQRKLKKGIHE